MSRRPRRPPNGYVLVLTLVMLVVAVLSLSGLARRSLRLALEANELQANLQHRWAALSCRDLLLYRAGERFEAIGEAHLDAGGAYPTPSQLRGAFRLGEAEYRFWLTAEDSRVNLNTLRKQLPVESRGLALQLVGTVSPPRLNPDISPRAAQLGEWYTTPGQVYDLREVFAEQRVDLLVDSMANVTCWGRGKLDLRTAGDALLDTLVTRVVSGEAARELIEARRQTTDLNLRELVAGLDIRRTQQSKLRRWLTDEAGCYSLWVEVRGPQRTWYHLWVDGHGVGPAPQNPLAFLW